MKNFWLAVLISTLSVANLNAQLNIQGDAYNESPLKLIKQTKPKAYSMILLYSLSSIETKWLSLETELLKPKPINPIPRPLLTLNDPTLRKMLTSEKTLNTNSLEDSFNKRITPEKIPTWKAIRVSFPIK